MPMTAERPLRAFIYDRNSRVINGITTSTEDQRLENQRLCERNGWEVAGEFCDAGRSASRYARQAREDYERMLAGIRAGQCDVLVVWEASRVSRSVETFVDLRKLLEQKNVLLCTNGRLQNMSDRSDRFMSLLAAAQAEDEAHGIRDRILRTTRLNAERGGVHGRLPFGYRREYDQETGTLLRQVPDDSQAPVVLELIARVASGKALRSIATDFERRGLPAPPGGWTPAAGRRIALRASNIGLRSHNGSIVGAGTWEPICATEEQVAAYYAAVRILGDPARRTQRDIAVKHLLSGIAECGPCAAESVKSLLRRGKRGRERDQNVRNVYTCMVCNRLAIGLDLLDGFVQAAVLKHVEKPAFAAALQAPSGTSSSVALAKARALEEQLMEARRAAKTFENGKFKMSISTLTDLEDGLLPQIAAARAQAQDASVPLVLRRLATADARDVWESMDLSERRTALRAVVKVKLNRAGKGARGIVEGRVEFDWLR